MRRPGGTSRGAMREARGSAGQRGGGAELRGEQDHSTNQVSGVPSLDDTLPRGDGTVSVAERRW